MKIEVLNTGTELLLGSVVNTHLAFLGEELFRLGLRIERQECVPDGPAIRDALAAGFARGVDVVLVTGGLGPTSDDLTRDIAAELLGRTLATDPAIVADLEEKFAKFGRRELNERIVRQAQVPHGAQVLYNHHGTAPGLYLPAQKEEIPFAVPHLFLLPGPPRELRPMFSEQVAPILKGLIPADEQRPAMRVHRLVGIGESWVEERVGATLEGMGLEVGYCARSGEVDLRLIGPLETLAKADEIVVDSLRKYLVTSSGETLEAVLVRLLTERKQTVSVAESCTGGLLAHRLTNCVGASNVFSLGLTTYTDEIKTAVLGVPRKAIAAHGGAVSAPRGRRDGRRRAPDRRDGLRLVHDRFRRPQRRDAREPRGHNVHGLGHAGRPGDGPENVLPDHRPGNLQVPRDPSRLRLAAADANRGGIKVLRSAGYAVRPLSPPMRLPLFLLLLVYGVAWPLSTHAQNWQRADIYFVDWDVETRASLSPEQVRRGMDAKFTLREGLAEFVSNLQLKRLRPVKPSSDGDTRLVVDLFPTDGGNPTTYHADRFHLFNADGSLRRSIGGGFRESFRALVRQHAKPNPTPGRTPPASNIGPADGIPRPQ